MGWRGKRDFTVLNNGVPRKGNDLVKRQKACETFTYNILQGCYVQSQPEGWFQVGTGDLVFPALTRLYHSIEDLTDEQISMVKGG